MMSSEIAANAYSVNTVILELKSLKADQT